MAKITKSEIQEKSVELAKLHSNLLLKQVTGVGKSLSFIQIQESLKPNSVYIVIAERNHKKNWIEEYKKHGKEHLLKKVVFFCYASLKNYANTRVDMICLDEGHHVTSDLRLSYLSTIRCNNLILLSATIKQEQIQEIEYIKGKFYNYQIPLKEAIENDVVPTPTFYLIPLELNNIQSEFIEFSRGSKIKYLKIHCEFKDRFIYMSNKALYPDLHLIIRCTQTQKEQYITHQYSYYKNRYFMTRTIMDKNKWLLTGSERKRYLADIKTSYVQQVLLKLQNKRFVCFCGSIKQARVLSADKNFICSEVKNSQSIIDSFNAEEIDNLFVVDMIQEGNNLTNIEVGVIVQLDGQTGPFIQKSGRIMRSQKPIILIFYFKNTRDEEYLDNVLKEINIEHIRVIDKIDDLII